MISAKEANYIAKYDNPQKELVDIATKQLIDYIEKRTINDSQKGLFQDSMMVRQYDFHRFGISEELYERSIKEIIEKVANILKECGYDIYYENNFIKWSWELDE